MQAQAHTSAYVHKPNYFGVLLKIFVPTCVAIVHVIKNYVDSNNSYFNTHLKVTLGAWINVQKAYVASSSFWAPTYVCSGAEIHAFAKGQEKVYLPQGAS